MTEVTYQSQLYNIEDAILNEEYEGFREDYLVLHSLIRKHRPKTFFEVGTNMGSGTNIICNAMFKNRFSPYGRLAELVPIVYSLDLPTELAHISLQHPISEGKGDKVGSVCKFPFTQLRGDSLKFDFSKYPCEGYWIDAEHCYKNVYHETSQIIKQNPKLIAYHDTDILEVHNAIMDAFNLHDKEKKYYLYRVLNTRISYAISRKMG